MKKTLVLLVALMLILVSCLPDEGKKTLDNSAVTRFTDDEAGVVCWVYQDFNRGGISCLPINDTKLPQ